ncbi:MAG: hypothetical protein C0596_00765 [Marinilabiliales bacterium]|nr:MAG: hypothetical protein C0596_00765 [Marinilabiliales bacterium]
MNEIIDRIEARPVCGDACSLKTDDFEYAFASDLMSDVLRLMIEKTILITGLCNAQTIRTAEMADIKLIIIARGKKADSHMIKIAEESNICLLETDYSVYRVCGELYSYGIKPLY